MKINSGLIALGKLLTHKIHNFVQFYASFCIKCRCFHKHTYEFQSNGFLTTPFFLTCTLIVCIDIAFDIQTTFTHIFAPVYTYHLVCDVVVCFAHKWTAS